MRIGFDRFLRRAWLDQARDLASAGVDVQRARTQLMASLADEIIGEESRQKTVRRLSQIWLDPTKKLRPLRDDAVQLYRESYRRDAFPLHWGMTMAVYPFFGMAAETMGRLLRLQAEFTTAQVLRRVRASYGERPTVQRAVERVLQSLIEWNVLVRAGQEGIYRQERTWTVTEQAVTTWLLEASLHAAEKKTGQIDILIQTPALFPCLLTRPTGIVAEEHDRLELFRQGLDQEMIMLRDD